MTTKLLRRAKNKMEDAILCVDIGTSSLKAAYMPDSSAAIAFSREEFPKSGTETAARNWLPALKKAVENLKRQSPDTGIEAVCISGNGPTVVSDNGTTLMWFEKTATTVSETKSMWIPRLDAYRKLHAHHWHESKWIFGAPEYLIYELTGKALAILPEERYEQIYWTEEQLKSEGFSSDEIQKLPPFEKPGALAGKITAEAAKATGLIEGTLVFCGAPDFIAALVGTDTLGEAAMCDRAGSSEGINLCTSKPVHGEAIRTMPSIISGMWNASVVIPDTGKRFADFKDKVESAQNIKITYKDLVAQIMDYDSVATQKVITKEQQQEGLAVINDVSHQLWAALNILKGAGAAAGLPQPKSMTITGGQALNERWTQIKCDMLCFPIAVTECADAELAGDNVFARVSLGYYDSIEEAAFALVKKQRVYTPSSPADKM